MTYLNLINMRRPNLRKPLQLLNMPHPKITNPDTPRPPLLPQPLQCLPQNPPPCHPRPRTMNQEQIHIPTRAPNLLHTRQQLVIRRLGAPRWTEDLGRCEDLGAREPGLLDCGADLLFVRVELGCVDVAVTGLEGSEAGLHALGVGGAVDAEPEAGDLGGGVGEGEEICDGVFWHFQFSSFLIS